MGSPRKEKVMSVFVALGVIALLRAPAFGADRASFVRQEYVDPQPTDPALALTWPNLIAENNRQQAAGFLHLKLPPGRNADIVLYNARLDVDGMTIFVSSTSGLYGGCKPIPNLHNTNSRASACPSRITIYRNGASRTIDAGYLCHVAGSTPNSGTTIRYDRSSNSLVFSNVIDGRPVVATESGDVCPSTFPLN
jgi:hypothetical protein